MPPAALAWFEGGLLFVLGAVIGSFLSALVHRLPRDESVVSPSRSYCPKCRKALRAKDLVPLVSFLLLRGRCRYCGERIGWRYFALEAITAALFLAALLAHGGAVESAPQFAALAADLVFVAILVAAFFIDLETMLIPDQLTFTGMGVGVAADLLGILLWGKRLSTIGDPATGWTLRLPASLVGLVVGGAVFFAMELFSQALFRKEGMGGGDLKLAAALGARLGPGPLLVLVAMAVFLGAAVGVGLILLRRRGRQDYIPFGPFLAVCGLAMILASEPILGWVAVGFQQWQAQAFGT
jgi:leader peptidase (prepilin peptidase)/N-methyltransferase